MSVLFLHSRFAPGIALDRVAFSFLVRRVRDAAGKTVPGKTFPITFNFPLAWLWLGTYGRIRRHRRAALYRLVTESFPPPNAVGYVDHVYHEGDPHVTLRFRRNI